MFGLKLNPKKIKQKNTKLLKQQGIDVIDHLPWLDVGRQRDDKEIAKRCVILAALLQLHYSAPREFINNYLEENDLLDALTIQEKNLLEINYSELEKQEQINLNWTIEAIWAIAWVGNLHDTLTFNTGVENSLAKMLPDFEKQESPSVFIDSFKARNQKEVFTELDKFYRAHWFARNKSLNNLESSLVNLDIIMERRKALEWVSDSTVEWDEISLDT